MIWLPLNPRTCHFSPVRARFCTHVAPTTFGGSAHASYEPEESGVRISPGAPLLILRSRKGRVERLLVHDAAVSPIATQQNCTAFLLWFLYVTRSTRTKSHGADSSQREAGATPRATVTHGATKGGVAPASSEFCRVLPRLSSRCISLFLTGSRHRQGEENQSYGCSARVKSTSPPELKRKTLVPEV